MVVTDSFHCKICRYKTTQKHNKSLTYVYYMTYVVQLARLYYIDIVLFQILFHEATLINTKSSFLTKIENYLEEKIKSWFSDNIKL